MGTDDDDEEIIGDLFDATESGNIRRVEELMQCGINPAIVSKHGTSPLHAAAVLESPVGPKIVKRMLSYGADPNIKTNSGLSPLHIASMWGRVDTINTLLDHGADIADKDSDDMSALDYAEDAEENKYECIDALTKFRPNCKRKSACFLTKSRYNLDKIIGGYELMTTFETTQQNSSEHSLIIADGHMKSISTQTDVIESVATHVEKLDGLIVASNIDYRSPVKTLLSVPEEFQRPCTPEKASLLTVKLEVLAESPSRHHHSADTFLDETLFKTCNEFEHSVLMVDRPCSHIASSTMIEDSITVSDSQVDLEDTGHTSTGYVGDISNEKTQGNETPSGTDMDETFWSVWSTPPHKLDSKESPITFRKKSSSKKTSTAKKRQSTTNSQLFIPLSGRSETTSHDDVNDDDQMLIKNLSNLLNTLTTTDDDENNGDDDQQEDHMENYMANEATVDYSSTNNVSQLVDYYEQRNDGEVDGNDDLVDGGCCSPKKYAKSLYLDVVNLREFEAEQLNMHDYSGKRNFTRGRCRQKSGLTVDYDWKDISFLALDAIDENNTSESPAVIPSVLQDLTNTELRQRLQDLGENPGPISATTRNVYLRYLMKLEKNPEKQKSSTSDKFKDYTVEMKNLLNGTSKQTQTDNEDLEVEMAYIFETPDKHTWREGTQKTSFNYLLLDPRVTKNLPARCNMLPFEEQLKAFVSAVFYIGKGKKSRPYEHFYEALKHERGDANVQAASKKIQMIKDIWSSGLGVVAIHVFHSIIPVEAYTREACMLEAMGMLNNLICDGPQKKGTFQDVDVKFQTVWLYYLRRKGAISKRVTLGLKRLTNMKLGDFYGPASSWSIKKKRLLGVHLITKAMKIYLIEGERQIRKKDITK